MQTASPLLPVDPAEARWVETESVHDVKIKVGQTQLQLFLIHSAIFGFLYGRTASAPLLAWYLVAVIVSALRWWHIKKYHKSYALLNGRKPEPDVLEFSQILRVSGFIWGISTYFVYTTMLTSPIISAFCLLIVTLYGIFATNYAATNITWINHFLKVFAAGHIVAIALYAATNPVLPFDTTDICLYIGIQLLYFWFLKRNSMRSNQTYLKSMHLQYRNAQLIQSLTLEREAALSAVSSKNRMLASATHDMRQPVLALDLYASWLLSEPEEARNLAPKIAASTKAVITLFDSMFDMSRLAEGHINTNLETINMHELMSELYVQYQPIAASKKLSFKTRTPPKTIEKTVFTDYILLQRILGNLISNAIKYTSSGGVLVACRNTARGINIEVWDTGSGISAYQQTMVFKEFYKSPTNIGTNDGFGLGLAIVKQLSELLGYELVMKSRVGSGTVVSIHINQAMHQP